MSKKVKIQYCQNCINNRKPVFTLLIGGFTIYLCKNCWIGFAYGLKKDFEIFDNNEIDFIKEINNTREFEKKEKK